MDSYKSQLYAALYFILIILNTRDKYKIHRPIFHSPIKYQALSVEYKAVYNNTHSYSIILNFCKCSSTPRIIVNLTPLVKY